jgi:hypothetical protein
MDSSQFSTQDILKQIVVQFGKQIFDKSESSKLEGLLSDFMAEDKTMQRLCKLAVREGIAHNLLQADSLETTEKNIRLASLKTKFEEDNSLKEEVAYQVVNAFAYSLGWTVTEFTPFIPTYPPPKMAEPVSAIPAQQPTIDTTHKEKKSLKIVIVTLAAALLVLGVIVISILSPKEQAKLPKHIEQIETDRIISELPPKEQVESPKQTEQTETDRIISDPPPKEQVESPKQTEQTETDRIINELRQKAQTNKIKIALFIIVDPDGYSNVREKPTTQSRILYTIKEGQGGMLEITDNPNWYKVIYSSENIESPSKEAFVKGWIHKSRVCFLPDRYGWKKGDPQVCK